MLGHATAVRNNDMHMDPAFLDTLEADVRAAMDDPNVALAFDAFEAAANPAKRWHNRLGLTNLILLILTLEFALCKLALPAYKLADPRYRWEVPAWLDGVIASAGLLLVFLYLLSLVSGLRRRWVLERFKAERIRHWKFQRLLDGKYVEAFTAADPSPHGAPTKEWITFLASLRGEGNLRGYVDHRSFTVPAKRPYQRQATFDDAVRTYQEFRLGLQTDWFNEATTKYEEQDRWTELLAKILLTLGMVAAGTEAWRYSLRHLFRWQGITTWDVLLPAAGICVLMLSTAVRVWRSASGISESAERYRLISVQLGKYVEEFEKEQGEPFNAAKQARVFRHMEEVERICHGELIEFIRSARKSDYFL